MGTDYEGLEEIFWGDGNVLYLGCGGDSYTGIYMYPNSSVCTLKMDVFVVSKL